MAGQWCASKRRSVAFADNNRPNSGACQKHSERRYLVITNVKLPEMDELLEETLVNNTNTVKPLTRREAQILQLIVSGRTNKEIARILCRTKRTVEYHRNRLMHKLNAHNAAELVKHAIGMGIV